jgi:hypothetical protein
MGKYIAQKLLAEGKPVLTLTNSTNRDNKSAMGNNRGD